MYLKGFADRKRGLGVYNCEVGKPSYCERDVKRVATQQDFYVLYRSDGKPDPELEAKFSLLEGRMRAILKRVRGKQELDADQIDTLCVLASMQEARSERHRHALVDPLNRLMDQISEEMRSEGHAQDQIDAHVGLFLRKNLVSGDIQMNAENIALLMVPQGVQTRYKFFRCMSKCIVESAAHDFITCDDPVTWTETFRQAEFGFNYLSLSAEVTYPLTRRHCLVLSYFPLQTRVAGDAEIVTIVNARTAGNALREVYAQPKDSKGEQQRLIDDILAVDIRKRPLIPRLIADPAKSAMPDLVRLSRDLGMEPGYLTEINQPCLDFMLKGQDGGLVLAT
jgi:hypothetical protein